MKKLTFLSILTLILFTSLVKNSTKEIEDKIFTIKENVTSLETEFGNAMLEFNYLSSPERLTQHKFQYFQNELKEININKIKKIIVNHNFLEVTNFIIKTQENE